MPRSKGFFRLKGNAFSGIIAGKERGAAPQAECPEKRGIMERKARVIIDIWIARIGTVFGWFWFVIYALVSIVAVCDLFDAKEALDWAMPVICIGLALLHFLLIRVSKRTRELISDFQYYALLLGKDNSISALCQKVKEPRSLVEQKLKEMCRRGYFKGRIDFEQGRLILTHAGEASRCPSCGATTKIYKPGDLCRYCGNPLGSETKKD